MFCCVSLTVCKMLFDESFGISGKLLVFFQPRNDKPKDESNHHMETDLEFKSGHSMNTNTCTSCYIQEFYNVYDLQQLIQHSNTQKKNENQRPNFGVDLIVEVYCYLYGNDFVKQIMN